MMLAESNTGALTAYRSFRKRNQMPLCRAKDITAICSQMSLPRLQSKTEPFRERCGTLPTRNSSDNSNELQVLTDSYHTRGKSEPDLQAQIAEVDEARVARKSKWHSKILQFRDEVDSMCGKFKDAVPNLKHGCAKIKAKLSPTKDSGETFGKNQRKVKVEYVKNSKKDLREMFDEDFLEEPAHNFSHSLVIEYLREGKFISEIDLNSFPQGDILIKIRNSTLEIFLNTKKSPEKVSQNKKHAVTNSRPQRIGEMNLPIYVNPDTLEFTIIDDIRLRIEGLTKGLHQRRLSISSEDLRVPKSRRHKSKDSPIVHRKYTNFIQPDANWCPMPKSRDTLHVLDLEFRSRAYTK